MHTGLDLNFELRLNPHCHRKFDFTIPPFTLKPLASRSQLSFGMEHTFNECSASVTWIRDSALAVAGDLA